MISQIFFGLNVQGVKKKIVTYLGQFSSFQTIFLAILRILTVTVYTHLLKTNLLLSCYVKDFKTCLVKLSKTG